MKGNLEANKVISKYPSGFRYKRSAIDTLILQEPQKQDEFVRK